MNIKKRVGEPDTVPPKHTRTHLLSTTLTWVGVAGSLVIAELSFGAQPPRNEVKSIAAPDVQQGAEFGRVSLDGDTLVVGAPYADNGGVYQGSAYIFDRNQNGGNNWGAVKTLYPSDATNHNFFGIATAVYGSIAVVGAYGNRQAGQFSGAAYLFERDYPATGDWGQRRKLVPEDSAADDTFGISLALDGDTLAVAADNKRVGNQPRAGAVYVFQRDQSGVNEWGQVKKLVNQDSVAVRFGYKVAISGDTLVVGCIFADEPVFHGGAAYVYERNSGGLNQWGLVAKLSPPDLNPWDQFGDPVAIDGDTIAACSAVNKTYVFKRSPGNQWQQVKQFDRLGALVLSAGTLVIGSAADGLAYVHSENLGGADQWGESLTFRPSDWAGPEDLFGGGASSQLYGGVAISGRFLAAGAVRFNSGKPTSGRAYVFRMPASLSVQGTSGGLLSVSLIGPPGEYQLQSSEDLVQWSDVKPVVVSDTGTVDIHDLPISTVGAQYYRVTQSE